MADKAINRTVEALNSNLLKLDNIQDNATANSTDIELRDRATHTGTQNISTINDLQTELDSKAGISAVYTKTEVDTKLLDKVDVVTGKQLSTEDYSTIEKNKVAVLDNSGAGDLFLSNDGAYKKVDKAFDELADTPPSYAGEGNKLVRVKPDETGLEFVPVVGGGDMMKSIYDTNGSNIVDKAEKVEGVDTAGNKKYYGTSEAGTVGFHALKGDVESVFGRTGTVTAQNGDYSASQVTNAFDKINNTMDDIPDGLSYTKTENNYTTAEKNKLAGIAPNAQVNTVTSVNTKIGDVVINKDDIGLSNVTNETQVPVTQKGVADGVATLDASGKIPTSQVPDTLLGKVSYKGTWDADTNTPTLESGVGNTGDYYAVNVIGNTLIDGNSEWYIADAIIFNGDVWDRIPNSGAVLSVNGKSGSVVINSVDVPYDNTTSGMASSLVKNAIDELDENRTMIGTGQVTIPPFVDNGDGTISLGNGVVRLFDNTSFSGKLKEYDVLATNITLVDNTTNYIVVNYNSGNPIYQLTTNVNAVTESNVIPCFTIIRNGTALHTIRWGELANGKVDKIHQRLVKTQRFAREAGLAISESPTREVQVTAGVVWYGANKINLDLINSAIDNIYFFIKNGGVWSQSTVSQYNNSQYQGTNDLVTLGDNRYAVNWLYRGVEDAKHLYMVLGNGDYTLAEAQGSQPPTDIPFTITSHAVLIGRIIVVRGASVSTQIDSAFNTIFARSPVTNHNNLADLQGGGADDYWHMTGIEWANNVTKTGSTFVNNQVPRFAGTTGKAIQNSLVSIDDNGSVNIPAGQTYQIDGQALSKSDVGLSNVDNTSDPSKPISTATQTALDNKVDKIIGKGLSTNDYTAVEKDKLGLIQAEATKNSTDVQLRDRNTHTGEQAISTITGLQAELDLKASTSELDRVNTLEEQVNDIEDALEMIEGQLDTIEGRINGDVSIMGVRFVDNGSTFVATRYGLTKGATNVQTTSGNITYNEVYLADGTTKIDDLPIFKQMRRGIFDNEGKLVYDQDDPNYDDTLTATTPLVLAPHTHFVGVYIPKFHYRYNVTYDQHVDGGETDTSKVPHTIDVAISDKPFTGSKVHEAFLAVDSSGKVYERAYVLPSAFEGVTIDKTTGEYLFEDRTDATERTAGNFRLGITGKTAYEDYMLASVNKVNAQAPTTGNATNFGTIAHFRQVAENRGGLATQQTFYSWHAINVLFMVYYASTDWQLSTTTGAGVTNLEAGDFNESVSVGYTSAMKNRNGYVSGIVRGDLGTTQVPNFKGIENPFGNVWKFVEGYKKLSTGLGNIAKVGIYDKTVTNAYDNFDVMDFAEERAIMNIPTSSNYFKFRNELMLPTSTTQNSLFYNDRFSSNTGGQILLSGGPWGLSAFAGGFSLSSDGVVSTARRAIGARLFY